MWAFFFLSLTRDIFDTYSIHKQAKPNSRDPKQQQAYNKEQTFPPSVTFW